MSEPNNAKPLALLPAKNEKIPKIIGTMMKDTKSKTPNSILLKDKITALAVFMKQQKYKK